MFKSKIVKCAAIVMSACAIAASCTKPVVKEDAKSVIVVAQSEASLEAGSVTIEYTIENPKANGKLVASSDAEWASTEVTESSIIISAEANDKYEDRQASVTLKYDTAEDVVIVVKQTAKPAPVIKAASTELVLDPMGGKESIAYTIENGGDDKLVASSDAEWVSVVVKEASVDVSYDGNDSEQAREASITLYYPNAEQVSVKVSQDVKPIPFTIEITSLDAFSVEAVITATDKDMPFFWQIESADYVESFESDDELLDEDIKYWEEYAAENYISFADLMIKYFADKESAIASQTDLKPETTYYVYVFGLTDDCSKPSTSIVKHKFTTPVAPPKEMITMNFDINVSEEEDHSVLMSVTASPEDKWYYAGIQQANLLNYYTPEEVAELIWESIVDEMGAYLDMYWSMAFAQGVDEGVYTDLEPATDYIAICFGVEPNLGVISNVEYKAFTSPSEPVVTTSSVATKSVKSIKKAATHKVGRSISK